MLALCSRDGFMVVRDSGRVLVCGTNSELKVGNSDENHEIRESQGVRRHCTTFLLNKLSIMNLKVSFYEC